LQRPRSPDWKQQTNKGAWQTEMRPNFMARRNGVYRRTGFLKNEMKAEIRLPVVSS
jgi:hypothetical protein